jgi:hypothetical protein
VPMPITLHRLGRQNASFLDTVLDFFTVFCSHQRFVFRIRRQGSHISASVGTQSYTHNSFPQCSANADKIGVPVSFPLIFTVGVKCSTFKPAPKGI